jgi:hypothetical protein
LFVRNWRTEGVMSQDGRPTGWNRVTFEISTVFLILLTCAAMIGAIYLYDAIMNR